LRPSYSVQDLKPISIKQPQNQNTPIHIDNSIKNNYTHSTYKSNSSEYSNKNPITQYPQKVTKINPVFIPSNSTFNIKKDINNKLNELNNPFKTNNFQQQKKNPTNFDLSNAAFKGNKNSNSIHPNINHLSDIKISTIKSNLNNNIYRVK
jgi:ribosome-associated toxin RatA of RatAB toxin-antitoxin module